MSETNPFGGKNKHGMYVPMTDDEMEVLARIAAAGATHSSRLETSASRSTS
jgi:hypothetical protein